MTDVYKPPFVTYAAIGGVCDATAKAAILANFNAFKLAIQPAAGTSAAHPDFDHIPAATAQKIVDEITAMNALIAAAAAA